MQIALDSADDGGVLRAHAGADQERFEERHRLLHRAGSDQHLGDEDLVGLELRADVVHRTCEGLEDCRRIGAVIDRGLRERRGRDPVAALHSRCQFDQIAHLRLRS